MENHAYFDDRCRVLLLGRKRAVEDSPLGQQKTESYFDPNPQLRQREVEGALIQITSDLRTSERCQELVRA